MNKKEEIDLRHKFEAIMHHEGFKTKMNALGKYKDPQVEGMWREVRERGET